ncbi:MAG: DUF1501 domain-containing protein [Planctomycetales bacterium]|nr:DUF1501 domain-containing protein [Planctomycetales bacterium]
MLTILGRADRKSQFCDRLSRRGFLQIGGAAMGGLSLTQMLAMEAQAAVGSSHKAIINIYLPGGPSHIDMWDPKPQAPAEIRGEFKPIKTNVSGIEICEMFPRVAAMMDKFAIIRSLADSDGAHDCYQCMTGYKKGDRGPNSGWPAAGSWVSRLGGSANQAVPANLSLMYPTGNRTWGEPGTATFLGPAHNPFNLVGRKAREKSDSMVLQGVTLERLQDRHRLRAALDQFRRQADVAARLESFDAYAEQAMGILTSSRLGDALDLSLEDPAILARYGESDTKFQRDGAPKMVENFCIARRLVEAGARYVSLNYSRWDWHGGDGMNFPRSREEMPLLDQALSALVTDLHERGLDRDVSVVMWGEFGRTPKINKNNSRDHWPKANAAILAGGGMRTGQVIGATNRYGEEPAERPVKFQEVFATLYHNLGLDAHRDRVFDGSGTPRYPVPAGIEPIRELI